MKRYAFTRSPDTYEGGFDIFDRKRGLGHRIAWAEDASVAELIVAALNDLHEGGRKS